MQRQFETTAFSLSLFLLGSCAVAQQDASVPYEIETVAQGLNEPWGMDFMPDGRLLVTERGGALKLIDRATGDITDISGVPEVDARGQGGLLDVALHPDFADDPWIYMTYAGNDAGQTATYLGRARLDADAATLRDLEVLHVAEPHVDSTGHYGSRVVFDGENRVYYTAGDRQFKNFGPDHHAQDTTNYIGTTMRLNDDGSVPADNPFVGDPDVRDSIYSYGHRNVQGMAFHPDTGALWQNEHGENNGDEINIVEAGGNYGWPVATYGVRYGTGRPFAQTPPENPETTSPVYHWAPDHPEGFPPSGFAFYDGDAFPAWRGNALMGNLAHRYLGRFTVNGEEVEMAERLLDGEGWRIRDVAVGPDDGFVYVLIDATDVPLIRLRPAGN